MSIYILDGVQPELPGDGKYWIAPNASVIGKVRLGPDVSVWFGTVLRGDNEWISIGAGSNIQDGSVLHADEGIALNVGADVTIGHGVIAHGVTIGAGSLIGMGATLLNNVKIGVHCLVGAHALLPEGKEYPDRSLIVGVPGRVVRTLSEKEAALLPLAAKHYVANAQRFRRGLRKVEI